MSKHLVYIDQNIVGLQLNGTLNLTKCPNICWIYSKEHFAEIRRSDNGGKYLKVLEDLDAKLLDLEMDTNWKITGNASVISHGTPLQQFEAYLDATSDVEIDDTLFDSFLTWVNGGGNEGLLKQLPDNLREQILSLTHELPINSDILTKSLDELTPDLNSMIAQMVDQGNDIMKTRRAFGDGKGIIGSISGEKQIEQIWNIIEPIAQECSIDQFFGFDPIDKQGYESWPIYLGIVGCCTVLDIVGFQAEKKCRKLEKIPNVRSDAGHIAMGAFCSAILSGDARLARRAKAIYEYKSIKTIPLHVKTAANKRMHSNADQQ